MIELNLLKDVKGNKRNFCKCIDGKRKTRESVGPLQTETGELSTWDMKAEALNGFFASVFIEKCSSYTS